MLIDTPLLHSGFHPDKDKNDCDSLPTDSHNSSRVDFFLSRLRTKKGMRVAIGPHWNCNSNVNTGAPSCSTLFLLPSTLASHGSLQVHDHTLPPGPVPTKQLNTLLRRCMLWSNIYANIIFPWHILERHFRSKYIRRWRKKLYRLLLGGDARPSSRTALNASGSTPRSASCSTASATSSYSTATSASQRTIRKRQAKGSPDDYDDSDDDEDSRSTKRLRDNPPPVEERNQPFACPYRKHDPQKYALHGPHTRCALAQLQKLSRVKEHLYRYHLAPIHCMRCWEHFTSEDALSSHVVADSRCPKRGGPKPDGITATQEKHLRNRKRPSRYQTEAHRWMEMYIILFPGAPLPNSPYFEQVHEDVQSLGSTDISDYEEYTRKELPGLVRSALERELGDNGQVLSNSLVNRLQSLFQTCQEKLFSNYKSKAVPRVVDDVEKSEELDLSGIQTQVPNIQDAAGLEPLSNPFTQEHPWTLEFEAPVQALDDGMLSFSESVRPVARDSLNIALQRGNSSTHHQLTDHQTVTNLETPSLWLTNGQGEFDSTFFQLDNRFLTSECNRFGYD